MAQTVNVPGVGQLNFPDNMSQADMAAAIQKNYPEIHGQAAPAAPNPTDGNSFLDNAAAGVGKGATDLALGAKQRFDDLAAFLENHFGGQSINAVLGMNNASDIQKATQAEVDDKRRLDAPLMQTAGGKVGNFIADAVPAVAAGLVPGGQGLAGTMLTGAALGAAEPTTEDDSVLRNTALGAAGGAAGYGAAKAAASVINPASNSNAALQLLKDEGIEPTIGQTLGGAWNKLEQKMQSLPILGDGISAARNRVLNQFDNAAINRATAPIGVQIDGTGQPAVKEAGDALSAAYDSALSQVNHVTLDDQFSADLNQLHDMAQNMTPLMTNKFNRTLDDLVLGRVSKQGSMLGDTYKAVDSELGGIASKWQSSPSASEAEYGDAISQLQNLLNQNMRRSNPQVADHLDAIDTGWANLVRIEAAAKAGKNAEGVFTPAQLNAAVQSADDSTRGRAVARGTALMQDLSNAGQSVLGGTVPDSGTATRMMSGVGALASGFLHPGIPLSLAGGAAAYSRPMQNILNGIISNRPSMAAPVSNVLRKYSAAIGELGAAGALSAQDNRNSAMSDLGKAATVGDAIYAAHRALGP